MSQPTLTLMDARNLLLAAQGMLTTPPQPATKEDVLAAIRRMGVLQIDTIHVVARSPYLVLFSRLGDYNPRWLDELLAEGRLFEYWSHAACFLPIEDYPLYRPEMLDLTRGYYGPEWRDKHLEMIERVLNHIRQNGEVRSADFERSDGRKGTWWDWKEEKQVLEYLHTNGEVMIARRDNFQRVYDLRERILPGWDDDQALPRDAARETLAVRAVRHLGAAPARWVPDYYRLPKKGMAAFLERMAGEGRIHRVTVEGWSDPWYVHADNLPLLNQALAGELKPAYSTLLSPFDPLTWDRERARALFDFDYTIECYTPEAKRRYGYFSLPILVRGELVGRLDAKAHRKEKIFEVKALHLEPRIRVDELLADDVAGAIQRCADWHGTPQVIVRRSDPEMFAALVERQMQPQQ